MAFENSPSLDNPSKPVRTLPGWYHANRFKLIVLVAFVLAFEALFLIYRTVSVRFAPAPGGMDGCLTTDGGAAFTATVWVDTISTSTDADGCFFFDTLTPGTHQFQVQTGSGIVYRQTVVIQSGQAVGLGTIQTGP